MMALKPTNMAMSLKTNITTSNLVLNINNGNITLAAAKLMATRLPKTNMTALATLNALPTLASNTSTSKMLSLAKPSSVSMMMTPVT